MAPPDLGRLHSWPLPCSQPSLLIGQIPDWDFSMSLCDTEEVTDTLWVPTQLKANVHERSFRKWKSLHFSYLEMPLLHGPNDMLVKTFCRVLPSHHILPSICGGRNEPQTATGFPGVSRISCFFLGEKWQMTYFNKVQPGTKVNVYWHT